MIECSCGEQVDISTGMPLECPSCGRPPWSSRRRSRRRVAAAPAPGPATAENAVAAAPPVTASAPTRCPNPGCGEIPAGATECTFCGRPVAAAADPVVRAAPALRFPWGVVALDPSRPLDIGREPEFCEFAHAVDEYPNVSRRHARVEHRPDGLYVTDLGSTNGVFVDGREIAAHVPERVPPGSQVRLGAHLTFTADGGAA